MDILCYIKLSFFFKLEKEQSSTITQDVETGVIQGGKKHTKFFGLLSPILLQAFTLTFLAEWGDRSQIATILLASREVGFQEVNIWYSRKRQDLALLSLFSEHAKKVVYSIAGLGAGGFCN